MFSITTPAIQTPNTSKANSTGSTIATSAVTAPHSARFATHRILRTTDISNTSPTRHPTTRPPSSHIPPTLHPLNRRTHQHLHTANRQTDASGAHRHIHSRTPSHTA